MSRYVLDAFSLIAVMQDEAGAAKVQQLLESADQGDDELYMSVVNLGEVIYIMWKRRGVKSAESTLAAFDQLPVKAFDVDLDLALRAAAFKAGNRMSYADCFAIALAQRESAALVTGDPDFRRSTIVPIEWLPTA
jgi:ribonuclease VapC